MSGSRNRDELSREGGPLSRRGSAFEGFPKYWTDSFQFGARGNGLAFVAMGSRALASFAIWADELVAQRVSRPNEVFGIAPTLGPGAESLDAISFSQIQPAVTLWVDENFYYPPEAHTSRVGFFESERRVRERDRALNEERRLEWEQQKLDFRARLVGCVREQVVRSMAVFLGVPERLVDEFTEWLTDRRSVTFAELSQQLAAWSNQPEFPAPPAQEPQGISHAEYEAYCCSMLQSWGYLDASTTRYVQDGGVDVESADLVVQCKHVKGNVGAPDIQKIFGIASKERKTAVLFSAGGFTKEGLKWANQAGVALITLKEIEGTATPQNETAKMVMARKTERL